MSLFSAFNIADYQASLPKPIDGTCQWILKHPEFSSWIQKEERAILWVDGDPGCGKTMHTVSITRHFSSPERSALQDVYIYFCDDKVNKQKNARGILMGLIHQIVDRDRSMIRHVRRVYDLHGSSMVQSFALLWGLFTSMVKNIKVGPVYFIIDALDECEKDSCAQLLEAIYEMAIHEDDSTSSKVLIKFLLTSRPGLDRPVTKNCDIETRIRIGESQAGYVEELQTFIEQRVEQICLKRGFDSGRRETLVRMLTAKADQTFLWLHMVLRLLEDTPLSSSKDFEQIVTELPPDLSATYLRFISSIPPAHQNTAARLLKLLLTSSRSLELNEINIAFTIDSSHSSTEDVSRDCQGSIAHTIQKILGPMTRMSDSKVSLVHQSAKDFLLKNHEIGGIIPALMNVNTMTSSIPLASACINYLLLEDFQDDVFFADDSLTESDAESVNSEEGSLIDNLDIMFLDQEKIEVNRLGKHWSCGRPDMFDSENCRILAKRNAFYTYASLHWAEHFAVCEPLAPTELKEQASILLDAKSPVCRNWFHFFLNNSRHITDIMPVTFESVLLAAYFGLCETLLDLLDEGASQQVLDQALFWAARNGHGKSLSALLEAGADPNSRQLDVQTALTAAAKYGHLDCVALLLSNKRTDHYLRGSGGRDALSFACGQGHMDIVKEILRQKSSKADEPDKSGATPVFYAAGSGHLAIVTYLIKYGKVNINHQDNTGRTVLSWIAGDGLKDVLVFLLDKVKGIDINLSDRKGISPLSWAAAEGQSETVKILVNRKRTNKASLDQDKRSAISWACGGGHPDVLRILLEKDCPGVDDLDVDGWTPLAWAIQQNAPEVVKILASTGAVDLNRQDRSGRTALYWAAEYGHLAVVKQLIDVGADPSIKSENGRTPIDIAIDRGREDMKEALLHSKPLV
jgi:ankyrin repeat protein